MPTQIPDDHLDAYGIRLRHDRMDNGQLRFRLMGRDGSGYIRAENNGRPVWENSHAHSHLRELVLVQRGRVVFVELVGNKAVFQLLHPGEFALTTPGMPHNECVDEDTVVHTIKYGDCENPDWIASPALDALTKPLSFSEALALAEARMSLDSAKIGNGTDGGG